jgi:hypothetical protein
MNNWKALANPGAAIDFEKQVAKYQQQFQKK